jgi:hypothetical protein
LVTKAEPNGQLGWDLSTTLVMSHNRLPMDGGLMAVGSLWLIFKTNFKFFLK